MPRLREPGANELCRASLPIEIGENCKRCPSCGAVEPVDGSSQVAGASSPIRGSDHVTAPCLSQNLPEYLFIQGALDSEVDWDGAIHWRRGPTGRGREEPFSEGRRQRD